MKKSRRRTKEKAQAIQYIIEPHPNNLRGVPLKNAYPEKTVEWYYKKNCGFGPEDFSYGSKVVAWWKCPVGHIYDMRILDRTLKGSNCSYCNGKRVCKENLLSRLFPKIAREWHPDKNGELKPDEVIAGSHNKVWWQCKHGHSWQASIKSRTAQGSGCSVCHGKRCLNLRNYPKLLKLFDQKKNKGVNPERLTITTFVWWRCPNGPDHTWYKPFQKSGEILRCPFCTWRLVSKTNSLFALYPELAKELHPTRNGNLTAKDIPAQKWLMVWWKCSENPRHVWQARVRNRTVNKSGCPKCWVEKRSKGYFKQLAAKSVSIETSKNSG